MHKILTGVRKFQGHLFDEHRELFGELAQGQKPLALLITCSDSRIVPNLITDTEPGDLFVIRNAGNMVPVYSEGAGGEAATIEYALKALKIRDIVVCGHSGCGAMTALMNPELMSEFPTVSLWIEKAERVRRRVNEKYGNVSRQDLIDYAIQENVIEQLANLQTHPAVQEGLAMDNVNLHGWVYNIGSGVITAYDRDRDDFLPFVSDEDLTVNQRIGA